MTESSSSDDDCLTYTDSQVRRLVADISSQSSSDGDNKKKRSRVWEKRTTIAAKFFSGEHTKQLPSSSTIVLAKDTQLPDVEHDIISIDSGDTETDSVDVANKVTRRKKRKRLSPERYKSYDPDSTLSEFSPIQDEGHTECPSCSCKKIYANKLTQTE